MEEQTESWQLRSGTWSRDPKSESWRLAAMPNGTVASAKLSTGDLARMIGARRDPSSGQWFPPDFNYSPRTGTPLQVAVAGLDSPWVPPFGASAVSDVSRPFAGGLRQTSTPLGLLRSSGRLDSAGHADKQLPALPAGDYRFLVHKFDVASPTLMAMAPEQGDLRVLMPDSQTWMPLQPPADAALAEGLSNGRGWRMEVVEGSRRATLYVPTALGLAALTPELIGLSYEVQYFGGGPALGGPAAWAGEVWLPVLNGKGTVDLLGKPQGTAKARVVPTSAPAAQNGFEAPVFDPYQVIWPSEEGQLVLRLGQDGKKETDWIAWPAGLRPVFSLGCPYLSPSGLFWQLCRRGQDESFEYVQMGRPGPGKVAVDARRLATGRINYRNQPRITGDTGEGPGHLTVAESTEIFVPLIESEFQHAVIGLRIDAPKGVLALLESANERHPAVLELQADNRADVPFGTLNVTTPWLASLFVYDGHLWVYHPELPQALGWKLES